MVVWTIKAVSRENLSKLDRPRLTGHSTAPI